MGESVVGKWENCTGYKVGMWEKFQWDHLEQLSGNMGELVLESTKVRKIQGCGSVEVVMGSGTIYSDQW